MSGIHYSSVFKEGDSTNPNQYTFDFSSIRDLLKKLYPNSVTVPPNSVTVPPNSVTVPPNSITVPPNSITVPPNSVTVPPNSVTVPSSTNKINQEFTNHELNVIRNFLETLENRLFRYNSKNVVFASDVNRNYHIEDEDEYEDEDEVNENTMPTPNLEDNDDCTVSIKGVSINYEGIETENYKKCI